MRSPSLFLLLGVSVLLLCGLLVCAVLSILPPVSWIRLMCHVIVICPFLVTTLKIKSVLLMKITAGHRPHVAVETTSPADEAQRLEEDYDDIEAGVTTQDDF